MKLENEPLFNRIPYQIDRDSPVPLYYQIAEALVDIIKIQRLEPNTRLPSEEHLCQMFGVSKMTVRQALTKLVRDGVLERRQGSGTFVAGRKIQRKATKLVSFFEDIRRKGLVPSSRVLEKAVVHPQERVMERLRVAEGDRIIQITRVRFAGDLPLAVNRDHIPEKLCPGLLQEDLDQISLSQLLEETYHLGVEYAVQDLQAVRATDYEAGLLEIGEGDPLLQMERTMFNHENEPLSYYLSLFRGDKYVFSSILYR